MSFTIWTKYFRDNDPLTRIPAKFLNKVRHEIAQAVDQLGGTYTPLNLINVIGAGMKLGNVQDSSFFGTFTRAAATFRNKLRIERKAPTTGDVFALSDAIVDIISVDGSGMTGNRTVELGALATYSTGMVAWVVVDPTSSFDLDIDSAGSDLNPIFTLQSGTPAPWVKLWFDATLTSTNAPNGTWRPFAHGES